MKLDSITRFGVLGIVSTGALGCADGRHRTTMPRDARS